VRHVGLALGHKPQLGGCDVQDRVQLFIVRGAAGIIELQQGQGPAVDGDRQGQHASGAGLTPGADGGAVGRQVMQGRTQGVQRLTQGAFISMHGGNRGHVDQIGAFAAGIHPRTEQGGLAIPALDAQPDPGSAAQVRVQGIADAVHGLRQAAGPLSQIHDALGECQLACVALSQLLAGPQLAALDSLAVRFAQGGAGAQVIVGQQGGRTGFQPGAGQVAHAGRGQHRQRQSGAAQAPLPAGCHGQRSGHRQIQHDPRGGH